MSDDSQSKPLSTFDITGHWRERPKAPSPETDDAVDATRLERALLGMTRRREGDFVISIGDSRLEFDVRPDLSTIFGEIPRMLRDLATKGEARLYFFEQGTDITLVCQRKDQVVRMAVELGRSAGERFKPLLGRAWHVRDRDFTTAWQVFARRVLKDLTASDPGLMQDASYRRYLKELSEQEEDIERLLREAVEMAGPLLREMNLSEQADDLVILVQAGEYGVALEQVCSHLEERGRPVPPELLARLEAAGTRMGMPGTLWKHLKPGPSFLLHSRVRVITDRYAKEGVARGAIGYIIIDHGPAYEVAFSRPDGTDYAQLVMPPEDLESAEEA